MITRAALPCVALALLACGSNQRGETPASRASSSAAASSVSGPFANGPVAPSPIYAALPTTAANAPLQRAPNTSAGSDENGSNNTTNNGATAPAEPAIDDEAPANGATRDRLIDALLGVWADGPTRTERAGHGYVLSECVLTIRSATDAREECTTTTRYGDQETDRCGTTGTLRRWITASPYTLSVSNGAVVFTPGDVELVRDDESSCGARTAGQHTTMTTVGWTGRGAVLEINNTRSDGSEQGRSSYRRRSTFAR